MQLAALMPFAALCLCACKGPALHLHNPEQHPVFVDGTAETRETLPFRYYGTTRWDALPRDVDGEADWKRQPASQLVAIPPPASPLLFPLDLPLEFFDWLIHGKRSVSTTVTLPPNAANSEQAPAEGDRAALGALRQRAQAAREQR